MTCVITEPCFGCKYTDCVTVCPVDCFYEGENMLFINPDECTTCEACIAECPVEAIYLEADVLEKWNGFIELNREMSQTCPNINEKRSPVNSETCAG